MTHDKSIDAELEAIARSIPGEVQGFSELRRLLGTLPSPAGPLLAGSSQGQIADPQQTLDAASPTYAGYNYGLAALQGMGSPVSNILSGSDPGSQSGADTALASAAITDAFNNLGIGVKGFGSAVLRYLLTNIYNSDFALLPRDPASVVGDANPLPFWRFVALSGTSIAARIISDLSAASGKVLQWEMSAVNGAAGDDAYLEQIIPVAGARGQSAAYSPADTIITGPTVSLAKVYINYQYLKMDGVTTTGASVEIADATNGVAPLTMFQQFFGATILKMPSDAYYLRLRIGFRRATAAVTVAETLTFTEVRIRAGTDALFAADQTRGDLYGPTRLVQNTGQAQWTADVGGSNLPTITMDSASVPKQINLNAATLIKALTSTGLPPVVVQTNTGGRGAVDGKRPVVNVYTANNTWTPPTDLQFAVVELVGGGGQGGGSAANVAGNASQGGGGGGGGYARKVIDAINLAGNYTVTVGAGGSTGGAGVVGQNGANSSFVGTGQNIVGAGGTGGGLGATSAAAGVTAAGGAGGAGTGGDVGISGGHGLPGSVIAALALPTGAGGGAALGSPAAPPSSSNAGGNAPDGGYGGGGSGATGSTGAVARAGGAGFQGIVIVTEYYGP